PVTAADPGTIVADARGRPAAGHRHQMTHGDGPPRIASWQRLEVFGKKAADRRIQARQMALFQRNAGQCIEDALGGGLDIVRPLARTSVRIAFTLDATTLEHDEG